MFPLSTERATVVPAYRARLAALGLARVADVLARVAGRVAAWSRTTDTIHVAGPDGTPGFYVKRHFFPTWTKRLRGTFRGTFFGQDRGREEFAALETLRRAGLPVARPVACGVRRVGHFVAACYLITEETPGAVNLTTYALDAQRSGRPLSHAQRRGLAKELLTLVMRMHGTGLVHGNLFWRNVLVRPGPDETPEFFLLDVQMPARWARRRRDGSLWRRELAQLGVSALPFTTRSERLRFLRGYFNERKLSAASRARIREIACLAQQWERHEQRRIRMNELFETWNRRLDEELAAAGEDAELLMERA